MKRCSAIEQELFWTSKEGQDLLLRVSNEAKECGFDAAKTTLKVKGKKSFGSDAHLSEAVEIVIARHKARAFGSWCEEALFTKTSLEQCTHPEIAKHHAKKFDGFSHVLEIGTGAGFDTAALSRVANKVTTIEADEKLLKMAKWNLNLQGIDNVEFIEGDAKDLINSFKTSTFEGIFSDPSRRLPNGERTKNPEEWSPTLGFLRSLDSARLLGVKASPAVDIDDPEWVKEWIGFQDECKEQVLWRSKDDLYEQVTIVDKGVNIIEKDLPNAEADLCESDMRIERGYLIEPHPALSRSGFFSRFLKATSARLLHNNVPIGYSLDPTTHLAVRVFKILDSSPFHAKKISTRIKELRLSSNSLIKTQGVKESPESIKKNLTFDEDGKAGVIYLVRLGKEIRAFICEKV